LTAQGGDRVARGRGGAYRRRRAAATIPSSPSAISA
jgi:hypothetical protein